MSLSNYPLLPVVLHTIVIYVFLMAMLRLIGRRQLGQLTVIDLVVVILLGSAVETAMVNGNTSLQAGMVCAGTLLFLNRVFSFTFGRYKRLSHLADGGAILLIHNGHFVEEHLRRVGLTKEDVLEALREREDSTIENVRFAVMEKDGKINVVLKAEPDADSNSDADKDSDNDSDSDSDSAPDAVPPPISQNTSAS